MKRIIQILFLLLPLLSLSLYGQTTNVTFQVTDTPDNQTWNNGSWSVQLQPLTGNINDVVFKISSTGQPVPNIYQTGSLNASGQGTVTLTPNTAINPIGNQWNFTVCPQATAKCYTQQYFIFGTAQSITITPPSIRISADIKSALVLAYTDTEVNTGLGQIYYNILNSTLRICGSASCNGSGFVALSGGGGSGCLTNPADGGCAITGNPSIDLFINGVGTGTNWVLQALASGIQLSVPLNINTGAGVAGVVSVGCGTQPTLGSNVAIAAPTSCTPYILLLPPAASSGYLQITSGVGNIATAVFESAINLASTDVTGSLPVLNGGTGATTGSGALINLFPTPTKAGDWIYWNGTAWINFTGCSVSACILSENGAGVPGYLQTPLNVPSGGTGLVTIAANTVYMGNGTGAMIPSHITDSAGTVTITEPISVTSCTGCGGGGATWSGLGNPTANLALTMGAFTTTFTYSATTGAGVNLFTITDTLNNTGTGVLFGVNTASGSAAIPIQFTAGGTANGIQLTTAGLLQAIGTGGIKATQMPLSSLTAAIASNTTANGNFPQVLNFAQTTASQTALTIGETSAATGAGDILLGLVTLSGSTASPLNINQGAITGTVNLPAINIATTLNNASYAGDIINVAMTNTSAAAGAGFLSFFGGLSATTLEMTVDKLGNLQVAGVIASPAYGNMTEICGGNPVSSACTLSNGAQVGGVQISGANNSNSAAATKAGSIILFAGQLTNATPNAAAMEGLIQIGEGYLKGTSILALGDIVCMQTTAYTVTDCSHTGPAINIIGIVTQITNPVSVITSGDAPVKLDNTATIGDIVCMGTVTDGQGHDNGTSVCATAGTFIGVVTQTAGSVIVQEGTGTGTVTLSTGLPLVHLRL